MADIAGPSTTPVEGAVAEGSAVGENPVLIGLDDGTNAIFAQATAAGDLKTSTEKIAGTAVSVNSGAADAGTQRVAVASNDVNLSQSHTRNEAFKEAAAVGGELDDTAPVAATEGNVSPARITAQRAIHTNLRDNSGTEIGTAGAPVRVDPTGSTTQPVSGTVTANAGTGTRTVAGADAHDATASANPVVASGVAQENDDTAPPNQVSAEGDVARLAATRDGALHTVTHPPRIWHTANEYTTQQTDTTVKAAPGATLSLYITDIEVLANGAVTITLEEGTTTLKFRYYAGGQGDGVARSYTVPKKLTANTALTVTTSAGVTVFVGIHGYTAP